MSSAPVQITIRRTTPWALRLFTAVNIAVFVAWQWSFLEGRAATEFMARHFLVSPSHIEQGAVWTLLTSAISHNDLLHLVFNLYALSLFGRDVEPLVGPRGFAHLYIAGAVTASIGHVVFSAWGGTGVAALGASGAVMAIAKVSAAVYPNRRLFLFGLIPITQRMMVLLFVFMDVVGMVQTPADHIAHAAHLGGAVYGWLYARYQLREYLQRRLRSGDLLAVHRRDAPRTHRDSHR